MWHRAAGGRSRGVCTAPVAALQDTDRSAVAQTLSPGAGHPPAAACSSVLPGSLLAEGEGRKRAGTACSERKFHGEGRA